MVVLMLGAGALMLAYSLWFSNNFTPLDERFNMRRKVPSATIAGALLLRHELSDLTRISLAVDTLDNQTGSRHGTAAYRDADGKQIDIEVLRPASNDPRELDIEQIFAGFGQRAGSLGNTSASSATIIRLHPESKIPYGYGVYSDPAYTYYEFTWVNNGWVFRASTREAGSESLLRFVNGYPY
jgi:hypothetical protein